MNLSKEVNHVIGVSTQALYFLLRFVDDIGVYIEQKKRPSSVDDILIDMSREGRSELGELLNEFASFMENVINYAGEKGKKVRYPSLSTLRRNTQSKPTSIFYLS